MKFHILIYGCQMNYSDSARLKSVLQNCWLQHTDNLEEADIAIFDTCSVRQKSEDKIFGKLKEIPKTTKIWITWCMIWHNLKVKSLKSKVETQAAKFSKWNFLKSITTKDPEILWLDKIDEDTIDVLKDYIYVNNSYNPVFSKLRESFDNLELFFRIDDIGFLPKIMNWLGYNVSHDIEVVNEYTWIIPNGSNMNFMENTRTAFVPIQTWCSQFCAYCIVPYSRWLEKNRPIEEVIAEVKTHVANWAQEIVLLGQIVNKHKDFYEILKQSLAVKWLKWLRYTSPYPTYYNSEILKLHENEEILCPHIHAPVQSWSDNVLKKMFRWYTSDQYKKFIDDIRSLSRPISVTTDIIVGFSDETSEDFAQTLDLVDHAKFDMIYMGIYSPRPGTYWANKYKDNISHSIKKDRWNQLNIALNRISLENNKLELGTIKDVVITQMHDDEAIWYTESMKHISFKADQGMKVWDFTKVKVVNTKALKLEGIIS